MTSLFVTDLHGNQSRYDKLFEHIRGVQPANVFIGGDMFPHRANSNQFITERLKPDLDALHATLCERYPAIYLILGNDDPRSVEGELIELERRELCFYCHNRPIAVGSNTVVGYSFVPPTPFQLKDWERYDVSRYVDPGCTPPDEGELTVARTDQESKWSTIAGDLEKLSENLNIADTIFLFHSPPYDTPLDRAALDGKSFEGVPLDVHVGSIAISRFIEERQPLLTLHGHVHESTKLTGTWRHKIGRTHCFNGAHDGPELAVIRFDPADIDSAERYLI
jgi:Icc-related predicted phosphoesterase